MKKLLISMLGTAIIFAAVPASAQTASWHIDLAAGLNLFQGEDDANIGLGKDRYTVSPVLTVGHWFSPSAGIQASAWGGQIKGLGIGETPYAVRYAPEIMHAHNPVTNSWEERFNYYMVQLEGTFNFNNCLCGFSEERTWNLIAHGGVEYAYSFNDKYNCKSIGTVAGLTSSWKVAGRVNLFMDYTLTVFGKSFDMVQSRNNIDDMMTVRAGITLNIGRKMKADKPRVTVDTYTKARTQDAANRKVDE